MTGSTKTTDTAAGGLNDDLLRVEYVQLNENGRMFWRSFFNLAAMSFAINGTLLTAAGLLVFSASAPQTLAAKLAALAIAVVALIYNIGAVQALRFLYARLHDILAAMENLPLPAMLQIPVQLRRALSPEQSNRLGALNVLFFVLILIIWFLFLTYAGYRVISHIAQAGP